MTMTMNKALITTQIDMPDLAVQLQCSDDDELFELIQLLDDLRDNPEFTRSLRDYFDQVCAEHEHLAEEHEHTANTGADR